MLVFLLTSALAQDPVPVPVPAPMPAGTDPLSVALAALGAGVVGVLGEHLRQRRASPPVDLSPLAARDPSGALILYRRLEALENGLADLADSTAALAAALRAADDDSHARTRRRRTD